MNPAAYLLGTVATFGVLATLAGVFGNGILSMVVRNILLIVCALAVLGTIKYRQ